MSSNDNGNNTTKRFWQGSCGIVLEPEKNNASGEYFWTYRFTRAFKRPGSDDFEYSERFTERNDEALGVLMGKAISFREQNSASEWVASCMQGEREIA
jgi:hypothetical protein